MKKLMVIGAVLVLAIGLTAGAMLWLTGGSVTTQTRVTIESVKDVARLATIKAYVATDMVWVKPKPANEKNPFKWIAGKVEWKDAKLMVLASAIIEGQVDLDKARITVSPNPKERHVTVAFPAGSLQVRDPQVRPDSIQCVTVANPNPMHPIGKGDRDTAIAAAMRTLKHEAIKMGIVEQTMEETTKVLRDFLASLGYQAEVKFESTPEAEKARWL